MSFTPFKGSRYLRETQAPPGNGECLLSAFWMGSVTFVQHSLVTVFQFRVWRIGGLLLWLIFQTAEKPLADRWMAKWKDRGTLKNLMCTSCLFDLFCKLWYITYKRPINIFCVYRYMRTTRNYVPSWKRWPWLWQPQRLLHGPRNGATRQKCRHVSFPKLYIACTEVVLFAGLGIWNQALESWIPQTYWKLWRFSDVGTAWFAGIAV